MRASRSARATLGSFSRPKPPILIDLTAMTNVGQGVGEWFSRRTSSNPPGDVVVIEDVRLPDPFPTPNAEESRSQLRLRLRREIEAEFEARLKNLEEENRNLMTDRNELRQILNSRDIALQESSVRVHFLENEGKTKDAKISHLNGLVELKESAFRTVTETNDNLQRELTQFRTSEEAQREREAREHMTNLKLGAENKRIQTELDDLKERLKKKQQIPGVAVGVETLPKGLGEKGKRQNVKSSSKRRRRPQPQPVPVPKGLVHQESNGHDLDQGHHFVSQTTVKVYRCSCGERFTSKPSLHLHAKRFNGGATWKCPREDCGDVFYTEEHFNAHSCKSRRGWEEVGPPKTWKRPRCSIPYVWFDKARMADKDYVRRRIQHVLGSGTDQL